MQSQAFKVCSSPVPQLSSVNKLRSVRSGGASSCSRGSVPSTRIPRGTTCHAPRVHRAAIVSRSLGEMHVCVSSRTARRDFALHFPAQPFGHSPRIYVFLTLDAGAPAAEAIKRMEQVYIMPLLRTTISRPLIFVGFLLVFCSGLPEVCNRLRNRVAGTKASGYRVPNVKDKNTEGTNDSN